MVLLKPEHLLRLPAALLCSSRSAIACSSSCRSIGSATAWLCCPRTKVQMAEGQGQDNGGGTVCSEGAPCAQIGHRPALNFLGGNLCPTSGGHLPSSRSQC